MPGLRFSPTQLNDQRQRGNDVSDSESSDIVRLGPCLHTTFRECTIVGASVLCDTYFGVLGRLGWLAQAISLHGRTDNGSEDPHRDEVLWVAPFL